MPFFGFSGPPDVEKLREKGKVRRLIKALNYKKDKNVRRDAAEALGEIGDSQAVKPLLKLSEQGDRQIRKSAMRAIGKIGDPRAVGPLITLLKELGGSGPHSTAASYQALRVREALVCIGSPSVGPLVNLLKGKDRGLKRHAAEALGEIGDPWAVEPLIGALKGNKRYVREEAMKALGEIGDPRAVGPLIDALKDQNRHVRKCAAKALAQVDPPPIEPLTTALNDENRHVRRNAALVLGEIGGPQTVKTITSMLRDEDPEGRKAAAAALDKLDWQAEKTADRVAYWIAQREWGHCVEIGAPAVEPLIDTLKDTNTALRKEAARALAQIGPPAVGPLIDVLQDQEGSVRFWVANALGKIGDPRAVTPLINAFQGSKRYEREDIVEALGRIGDPRAVEPLIDALNDDGKKVRKKAAVALGKIGEPGAVKSLNHTLRDKNGAVRKAAANALDKMGWKPGHKADEAAYCIAREEWDRCVQAGEPAVGPLTAALQNRNLRKHAVKCLDKLDWQPDNSKAGAAYYIGKQQWDRCANIGGPAVEPLIGELKNKDLSVRKSAAKTLVKIFKSGQLEQQCKQLILDKHSVITKEHTDKTEHHDAGKPSCHHDNRQHTDRGIGIDFPL